MCSGGDGSLHLEGAKGVRVIKGDVPGTRDRDEVRTRRRELNAAKEVTIPDYVMLDFVDDTPDTQQDPQRKTIEDPGLRY